MKKSALLCLWGSLMVLSIGCQRTDEIESTEVVIKSACGVKNPIEDLPWLKQFKDTVMTDKKGEDLGFDVYSIPYKGENVLWVYSGVDSYYPVLYSCGGQRIYIDHINDPDAEKLFKLIGSKEVCKYRVWGSPNSTKWCD